MNKFIKIVAALLLGVSVLACKKAPETQKVVFHPRIVEGGSVATRAADHNEILNLIQSTYPTITPKIWYDDDGNDWDYIPLNTPVTVPIGTHLFCWENTNIMHMTDVMYDAYLALEPYMDISVNITIESGVSDYSLPVNFNSVGFVWDTREVSNIYHNGKNGNLPQTKAGFGVYGEHYGIFFLNGSLWGSDDDILMLQVRPQSTYTDGKVTTYYFSNRKTEYNGNTVYPLNPGHYYVLHPDALTEIDGTFVLGFPDWVCDLD